MGASQTKQKSVLQQVNEIVNETVNKSSTSIRVTAQSAQNINISCTREQLELASIANAKMRESYALELKYYYQYGAAGKQPTPPIQLCTASNIEQKSMVTLKSDAQSKAQLANSIDTELKNKATQIDNLMKTNSIVGYSETDKTSITQIITNVKNNTFNENITNIVNSAIVDQNISGSGVGYSNISQEATVSLIAGAIVDNLTKDIKKSDLELEIDQDSKQEEKSGQVESVKAVAEMVSSMFASLMGSWILILVCIIGAVVMFPGVFCIIPPLRIPLGLIGLCSKKNNEQQQPNNYQQQYFQQSLLQPNNYPRYYPQPQQPNNYQQQYQQPQSQQPNNYQQQYQQPQSPQPQQTQQQYQQQQYQQPQSPQPQQYQQQQYQQPPQQYQPPPQQPISI
jgi:hypothetical protein